MDLPKGIGLGIANCICLLASPVVATCVALFGRTSGRRGQYCTHNILMYESAMNGQFVTGFK